MEDDGCCITTFDTDKLLSSSNEPFVILGGKRANSDETSLGWLITTEISEHLDDAVAASNSSK
jgi:hypothetical protein